MENIKVALFDSKPYDKSVFREVNEKYGFDLKFFKHHLNKDTVSLSYEFDAVCAFVNDVIDQDVVDAMVNNKVRVLAMRCAGYNNVDLEAAYQRLPVVRVPAYSPHAVAEHAAALIMSLNRKTHRAYYRTRDANFSISGLMGFDMYGKTAGIVGAGKIGKCLARILKGFGMHVVVYDAYHDKEFADSVGVEYVSLADLYSRSDVISLHCPLTPETHYMINEEAIGAMKKGVMIINTGRGKLINTKALIKGLKQGKIGATGLDVYEEEEDYFFEDLSDSVIDDDQLARLMTFPNVLITSHQGFFTKEALHNIADTTLNNIKSVVESGVCDNAVCKRCG